MLIYSMLRFVRFFPYLSIIFVLLAIPLALFTAQETTTFQQKAAITFSGNMSGKFTERELLGIDGNTQSRTSILRYFINDHRVTVPGSTFPQQIVLNGTQLTLRDKAGIFIDLSKVDASLVDASLPVQ